MQGPAPSHLPSPAAAPTSRHIPFVFAFPGGPLIELSRSISVAAAAVIHRLCGRAGTRRDPAPASRLLRDREPPLQTCPKKSVLPIPIKIN